jgi:CRISPR-associated protein Csm3
VWSDKAAPQQNHFNHSLISYNIINKTMSKKIVKKIQIQGIIRALTGLHIGGSNLSINIGGTDAVVIRNPFNNQPYIPGSSLKGKMRSLTERLMGAFGPAQDKNIIHAPFLNISDVKYGFIPKLYGTMPEKMGDEKNEPTSRIIVRDCALTKESADKLAALQTTDMPFTEIKTEVVIDRITAMATPRQLERVPAGAEFDFRMILNIYENDSESEYLNKIFLALALVESDFIGGKGTRGSGEVVFRNIKVEEKTPNHYENSKDWDKHSFAVPEIFTKQY